MSNATPPIVRNRSPLRRVLRAMIIFAAVPYVAIILLLAVFQRSMIYGPVHDASLNVHPPGILGARAEPISLMTADKLQLNGWHVIAEKAGVPGRDDRQWSHGKPLILYFCGNAGNRADRAEEFQIFAELGADAICFDYRGYGDNAGRPTEAAFADDARAIWRYVTEERGIEPRRVVIFGESLGGGVATRLASELSNSETPPAGLVLRSTFTRLTDVAAGLLPWFPVRWLMLDRFPSVERIAQVNCPILIFHGRRDASVPFALGERLFSAAPEKSSQGSPKRFIALETADHNDVLLTERDPFRAGLQEFLEQVNPRVAKRRARQRDSMIADLVRKLTYFPDRADDLSPNRLQLPPDRVHAIRLTTDANLTLNGWHFLADGHSAADRAGCDRELSAGRLVALFFSGNGGHRGYRIAEAGILTSAGADVFLFDYRGYGDNRGEPGEEGIAADARAVWRYATEERQVAPQRIVLYGESLGGAVATRLAAELCAAKTCPAGIVLRSTFSNLADVARHHYPFLPINMLLAERYASVERIPQVTCPILMLHGIRDEIVPPRLGRRLFDAASEASNDGIAKQFVDLPHSDHNDVLETDADILQEALSGFVAKLTGR